jgi:hypothetical protein
MQVKQVTIAEPKALSWLPRSVYHLTCQGSTILLLTIGLNHATFAQSNSNPSTPGICDVNLTSLKSTDVSKDPNIVTADTASAKGTTVPSLWWVSEQFPAKLVSNWIANRSQNQIYLLVNTQYWNVLDYVDRYRAIDRFGRVAQSYGYNLKVCNGQKIALARYTCDSTTDPTTTQKPTSGATQNACQIWLNVNGQDGLGVNIK